MVGIRVRVSMIGGAQTIEKVFHRPEISIGRSAINDVILKKANVSKIHCRAFFIEGKIMVGDSGSTNGTYVNGKRVTAWIPVQSSDEVWIGNYAVRFSVALEAEPKAHAGSKGGQRKSRENTRQRRKGGKTSEQKKTPPSNDERKSPRVKTPWEVLGVPKGTPKSEAKKAYLKMLAMYHPDKVDSLGPKLKELALDITRELNEAWAKIESGQA